MIVPVTPFQQNCSLICGTRTPSAAPSSIRAAMSTRSCRRSSKSGVTIEKILLTHGHIDHAGGAAELEGAAWRHDRRSAYGGSLPARGAAALRRAVRHGWRAPRDARSLAQGRRHGDGRRPHVRDPRRPGHTPGSVVFFNRGEPLLLWATCCSRARSGAPIFRAAIMRRCSPRSARSSSPSAMMSSSCRATASPADRRGTADQSVPRLAHSFHPPSLTCKGRVSRASVTGGVHLRLAAAEGNEDTPFALAGECSPRRNRISGPGPGLFFTMSISAAR